jgi:hypothetical protein
MLRPKVQSASLSWNKTPIWGLGPDLYYCQTVAGLLMVNISITTSNRKQVAVRIVAGFA